MRLSTRLSFAAVLAFTAGAVLAQSAPPPTAPPVPPDELRRLCNSVSMAPADGLEMARRAECVLAGVLPSPDRIAEARNLARAALVKGEPSGGLMLYLVFQADPANRSTRDGKVDSAAYRLLAARGIPERKEQIEAIEGLGFAAGKGNIPAGVLLAGYFHDTVAPRNVARSGAMAGLLLRNGERTPTVERFAREADAINRNAADTKASVRVFLEAYRSATVAASQGYQARNGGKTCDDLQLQSVSAGIIENAEFLPLQGNLVADSYLVRGGWDEFWTFRACGQEVPVKMTFQADGWGGSTSTALHHQGS